MNFFSGIILDTRRWSRVVQNSIHNHSICLLKHSSLHWVIVDRWECIGVVIHHRSLLYGTEQWVFGEIALSKKEYNQLSNACCWFVEQVWYIMISTLWITSLEIIILNDGVSSPFFCHYHIGTKGSHVQIPVLRPNVSRALPTPLLNVFKINFTNEIFYHRCIFPASSL